MFLLTQLAAAQRYLYTLSRPNCVWDLSYATARGCQATQCLWGRARFAFPCFFPASTHSFSSSLLLSLLLRSFRPQLTSFIRPGRQRRPGVRVHLGVWMCFWSSLCSCGYVFVHVCVCVRVRACACQRACACKCMCE